MKELYNRMNEHINPSPEAVDLLMNRVARRTEGRKPRRVFVPALALLALLLITPALAVTVPAVNELLYQIAPEVAMYFRPINRSATGQGITVSILAVDMEENNAVMYVAVQGEEVNETTMLDDDYYFRDVQCVHRYCTPERYNPETRTAVFRILYAQGHGALTDGQKAVFTVNRILLNRHTRVEKVPGFIVAEGPVETMNVQERFLEARRSKSVENVETVLQPGSLNIPLADGITVTAAGMVGENYHIQIRWEEPELQEDLMMVLMPPIWEKYRGTQSVDSLASETGVEENDPWIRTDTIAPGSDEHWLLYGYSDNGYTTFLGEDGARYTDYVYSRPMERLLDCALYFQLTETEQAVDGKWSITFPMADYTEQ